ncbi:MAG: EAL domain-containing protein [Gammaproteobacteria bacterium]|nr:EAL domain-containing protein [Gammaproteobacteria bacterium]
MKVLLGRCFLLWISVVLITLVALSFHINDFRDQLASHEQQWQNKQQLTVARKLPTLSFASVAEKRDAVVQLSLISGVSAVGLMSDDEIMESIGELGTPESLDYRIPVSIDGEAGSMLVFQFADAPNLPTSFKMSWEVLIVVGAVFLGAIGTIYLLVPILHLEEKAESILTGDFDPEHFSPSDVNPLTSELAINLLLNEHHHSRHQQTELSNRLRQHSFVDKLSGLGNREYFDAELEVHLSDEQILHGAVAIFSFEPLIELQHDNKEQFDDTIRQIGRLFQSLSSEAELNWVARRDNVDFAWLTIENSPEKLVRQCNKMIKDMQRTIFDSLEYKHHFVDVGITVFKSGDDPYEVMASADMALRHAQVVGDNNVHLYRSDELPKDIIKGSVRWRTFLQEKLAKRDILLFYQPQYDVSDSSVIGYETLSRLVDKDKVIAAAIFLPMASRVGLAVEFDRLIIDKVFKEFIYGKHLEDKDLSINLFPDSIRNNGFISWLLKQLSVRHDIKEKVVFEIPEYALIHNDDELISGINALSDAGIRWCVESVGNPKANLSYLREHEVSRIKVSRTIVRNIESSDEKQLFFKTLVNSANQLGVDVWAEGVESESEWKVLESLGAQGAQGYWFGQPVQIEEL